MFSTIALLLLTCDEQMENELVNYEPVTLQTRKIRLISLI
jgi:hypothetical protein